MDITQIATQLLASKLGTQVDPDTLSNALTSLLGGADGAPDIAGLVGKMMTSGDLQSLASSWLGDGANAAISPQQIGDLLGGDKLGAFASQLGVDSDSAAAGLAEVLPQVVDGSSAGGSLLAGNDPMGGLLGAVKSFL